MVAWNYLNSGGLAFLDVSVDKELLLTKDSDTLKGSTYIDLGQFYRPCTTSSKQVIYSRVISIHPSNILKRKTNSGRWWSIQYLPPKKVSKTRLTACSFPWDTDAYFHEVQVFSYMADLSTCFTLTNDQSWSSPLHMLLFHDVECCNRPAGCGKKPGKNSSEIFVQGCMGMVGCQCHVYFWKEETWLKHTHQKKELNLAHWVTIYRYMHICQIGIILFIIFRGGHSLLSLVPHA